MPRRQFIADLSALQQTKQADEVTSLRPGDDDGTVVITYSPKSLGVGSGFQQEIEITIMIPELSDYPSSHTAMIFTSDGAISAVAQALENLQASAFGTDIAALVALVLATVTEAYLATASGRAINTPYDKPESTPKAPSRNVYQAAEPASDEEDDWFGFENDSQKEYEAAGLVKERLQQLKSELRMARSSGFKVAMLGDPALKTFVTVSCQIVKLGLSQDSLLAWNLNPSHYLVLLLKYNRGCESFESLLQGRDAARSHVEMYVGVCTTYKPSLQSALLLLPDEKNDRRILATKIDDSGPAIKPIFITPSLNTMLGQCLLKILQHRVSLQIDWDAAETLYIDHDASRQGCQKSDSKGMTSLDSDAFPDFVSADSMHGQKSASNLSFPLVAMQFVLRHTVHCTKFCVVCSRRIGGQYEALKPYVCDRSLCLYQYHTLGFGPSAEQEILYHPYVVDLLVSFCYTAARSKKISSFPTGLALQIPSRIATKAKFDPNNLLLKFAPTTFTPCPFKNGDWIAVTKVDDNQKWSSYTDDHKSYRIASIAKWPVIVLGKHQATEDLDRLKETLEWDEYAKDVQAEIRLYQDEFDLLTTDEKHQAINILLDGLPDVLKLRKQLQIFIHTSRPALTTGNLLSPGTLALLRWIIYSNRACILQLGDIDEKGKLVQNASTGAIDGMNNLVQFRFAMGAPDKERRFQDSVSAVEQRLKVKYPTIFAWHGSDLANWHSIIREGLHFIHTVHGRAYGHGVYMSNAYNTSLGYSSRNYNYGGTMPGKQHWPHSILRPISAISLQEVVNAPNEFVSKEPHYVVANVDWIQSRYLFVEAQPTLVKDRDAGNQTQIPGASRQNLRASSECLKQDPGRPVFGPAGTLLVLPASLKQQGRLAKPAYSTSKDGKRLKHSESAVIDLTISDTSSVGTSASDNEFLDLSDDDDIVMTYDMPDRKGKEPAVQTVQKTIVNGVMIVPGKTDFIPGRLRENEFTFFQPPSNASTHATRALQRELRAIQKLQTTTPAHELGFTVDTELISRVSNMYQWIVELHSFDPALPLHQDMKHRGLNSIILEINFSASFPIAPPFVRVVRPRFLDFLSGGGGHVTAGGAICMELLTNSGWTPASSVESVIMQVRLAISDDQRPAKLAPGPVREYGVQEAVDAYFRAARAHGWTPSADVENFRNRARMN